MNPIIKTLLDNGTLESNTLLLINLIHSNQINEALEVMQHKEFVFYQSLCLLRQDIFKNEKSYNLLHTILESNNTVLVNEFFKMTGFSLNNKKDVENIEKTLRIEVFKKLCELNSLNSLTVLDEKNLLEHMGNKIWQTQPDMFPMVINTAYKQSSDEVLDLIEKHFPTQNIYIKAKYYAARENPKYLNKISSHLLYEQLNDRTEEGYKELRRALSHNIRMPEKKDNIYISTLLLLDEMFDTYKKVMFFLPNYIAHEQSENNKAIILSLMDERFKYPGDEEAYEKMLITIEKINLEKNTENSKINTSKLKI
jgi:hypothetical protein